MEGLLKKVINEAAGEKTPMALRYGRFTTALELYGLSNDSQSQTIPSSLDSSHTKPLDCF